jgi:hypothetical protein
LTTKGGINIVAKRGSIPADLEYYLRYDNASDRFQFEFWDQVGTQGDRNATSAGSPSTGVWYFLCVTHDSVRDTVNISVNAGTVDSLSWTTGINISASVIGLDIGAFGSGAELFNGAVDEVGIWKRVLTPGEIAELYNNGNGNTFPFNNFPRPNHYADGACGF